jgi:prolipoprotein diacylglyceryltransferase
MFFAEDASRIYIKYGKDVFKTFELSLTGNILGILGFAIFGGIIGYCIGSKYFENKEYEQTMSLFYKYIDNRRKHKPGEKCDHLHNQAA